MPHRDDNDGSDLRAHSRSTLRGDKVSIPAVAGLGYPLERLEVNVDDAEPLGVSIRPLEVVEQRPDEVAGDRDALVDRVCDGPEMGFEIGGPFGIFHRAVSAAHRAGAKAATDHLLALGHRRIALVTGRGGWAATVERIEGFQASLAAANVLPSDELVVEGDFEVPSGYAAAVA